MIEMVVRVDHILDGFVQNHLLDLSDDRAGTLFTLRSFNDDNPVLEVDCHGCISGQNQVYTVAQLLR